MGEKRSRCGEIERGDPCGKPVLAKGMCNMHYKRNRRHGNTAFRASLPWPENLLRRLLFMPGGPLDTPCIWHDSKPDAGGRYRYVGKDSGPKGAHVAMWELLNGPLPDSYEIDHLCNVPWCVAPSHLDAVTHAENCRRRGERQRAGLAGYRTC